ncbi:MAG: methylated-DNA--[protein]-cysteine S-methyltransferase [Acidobacteriota bacterium]|nr:methylated-DNA--[protein]-cysteine S-methyltransferase [Acidobacteriota bacterium]
MKQKQRPDDTLEIARALRGRSGGRAPVSLLPAVMRRVGLAETYWKLSSPVGTVFVARGPRGISLVLRTGSAARFEREFRRRRGKGVIPDASRPPRALVQVLSALDSQAARELELDLSGLSEFEQAVLRKALEIPRGEVRPYAWIAREVGRPDAIRAAGSALARNPVPLLIPCHRVVRSDGRSGDYVFGAGAKRELLETEGARPDVIRALAAAGVRFLGHEEKRFFCFPSCGGVDHLVESNRIRFGSAREAFAAGYHPCEDCRPAALAS